MAASVLTPQTLPNPLTFTQILSFSALALLLSISLSTEPTPEPRLTTALLIPPLRTAAVPTAALPQNATLAHILGPALLTRIRTLSEHTEPVPRSLKHRAVNRPFLSDAAISARALLITFMTQSGLSARVDAAGNVLGDLTCARASSPRRVLAMGSHYDTVPLGGIWDGAYGVLSAIAVAQHVATRHPDGVCALPFDLRVVAFDDEEGNNAFATTNFGAKAYAGLVPSDATLRRLATRYQQVFPSPAPKDPSDAIPFLRERLRGVRADPTQLLAFVELHIEQGPVLQRARRPLAVVDAIAGQTRLSVRFDGRAAHAGTVPMNARRDALAAAAAAVAVVERIGLRYSPARLVATVGNIIASPGSTNVIAGQAEVSIDVRAPRDDVRAEAVEGILSRIRAEALKRSVLVTSSVTHDIDAVKMTPWLRSVLESADLESKPSSETDPAFSLAASAENASECIACLEREEYERPSTPITVTSGAGHDTQYMARLTDIAMLFVRCKDGVSHHPDEHVSDSDSFAGALALLRTVDAVAARMRAAAATA